MQEIHKRLVAVLADVQAVAKDRRNPQQGYQYRSVEAVIDQLHALFAKHAVFLVPEVLEHSQTDRKTAKGGTLIYTLVRMKFSLFAADGSSVFGITQGEGMDSGDKSTNKAMSAALKYFMAQTFLIPFVMDDSERESPAPSSKPAEPPSFETLKVEQIFALEQTCKVKGVDWERFKAWALAAAKAERMIDIPAQRLPALQRKIDKLAESK